MENIKMEKVKINSEKCKCCLLCTSVCIEKCIELSDKMNKLGHKFAIFTKNEKCKSCGFCFLVCPDNAIEVYK
ncbi:MAG: 4Fe-4S binding protein [Elusimicrobiota bacterium]